MKIVQNNVWINRFIKNLREKLLNNAILLKPFVTVGELGI